MAITGKEFRSWALALPEVEEKETWGHPTFRVRDKIFASMAEDGSSAGLRTNLVEQAELIALDPDTYSVARYTGRHGWVTVALAGADPEDVRPLVTEAWRRTAPKRLAVQVPLPGDQQPGE